MGADSAALVARARAAGVTRFLVPGTTLADSEAAAALADPAAGIFAAVGVHPHEAKDFEPARDGARFEALARRPGVVAIGEIGLDFHYDHSPRPETDRGPRVDARLRRPPRAAGAAPQPRERGRDPGGARAARSARENAGVFHSFTENAAYGAKAIGLGYRVSFSGMITFRAAENIRSAAAGLPLEAMLVETDTPFLAPVPHRGKPCEPAYVVETAKKLAEVKGTSLEAVAAATTANFDRLFARAAGRTAAGTGT